MIALFNAHRLDYCFFCYIGESDGGGERERKREEETSLFPLYFTETYLS